MIGSLHWPRRSLVVGALLAALLLPTLQEAAAATFLFDATKAEMAGNADWVVDADLHNLKVSSAADGSGSPGSGSESNPQRWPTPAASGISAATPETYWQGALSAWAVDLAKHGHAVETLPYNGRISFRDASNPQDLTNYQVFVLIEPNIFFTAAERTALLRFVQNGGGLFIVSDHGGSDRNNDGKDSVQVLNDLMTNTVANDPFGIAFNSNSLNASSTEMDASATDPITHGAAGTASSLVYNAGATLMINTNHNASVRAAVWSAAPHATNNVMFAYATYGLGKIVASGDSSPFDDGTGDSGDTLYFSQGYADASTSAGTLILNASLWLAQRAPPPGLFAKLTGSQLQLSWAATAAGYSLQVCTNLVTGSAWAAVTNAPVLAGGLASVMLPLKSSGRCYRLATP